MIQTRDVVVDGAPAPAFFASPAKPRGALVVVHEIFGRSPEIERACRRLAEAGYAALMPDLFGDRFKPICIARALGQVRSGQGEGIDIIKAAADVVARESGVPRAKVGVIGFCLGGGFALAVGNAFAATSTNYGELPNAEAMKNPSPTIACYGTRDRSTTKAIPIVGQRLRDAGVPHEIHVLDAGHAFLMDGDHSLLSFLTKPLLDVNPPRDATAREEGWSKILSFFDQHL
jgi:carboxymethylenebutenolidase